MCLEEIALGYLTPQQVKDRADQLGKTDYADYLRRRASEIGLALRSGTRLKACWSCARSA
jgi:hypothetical protein